MKITCFIHISVKGYLNDFLLPSQLYRKASCKYRLIKIDSNSMCMIGNDVIGILILLCLILLIVDYNVPKVSCINSLSLEPSRTLVWLPKVLGEENSHCT